jgi:hypothetical protein
LAVWVVAAVPKIEVRVYLGEGGGEYRSFQGGKSRVEPEGWRPDRARRRTGERSRRGGSRKVVDDEDRRVAEVDEDRRKGSRPSLIA